MAFSDLETIFDCIDTPFDVRTGWITPEVRDSGFDNRKYVLIMRGGWINMSHAYQSTILTEPRTLIWPGLPWQREIIWRQRNHTCTPTAFWGFSVSNRISASCKLVDLDTYVEQIIHFCVFMYFSDGLEVFCCSKAPKNPTELQTLLPKLCGFPIYVLHAQNYDH